MWNDAQEYSTSLGTVLVQVCNELPPGSKFGSMFQNAPDNEFGKPLTTEDEDIEEIPPPARATSASTSSTVSNIHYPEPKTLERRGYKTPGGKTITQHQWDVYDFILTIPKGKVVTYKDITVALRSGSPRSVGAALRNNPFAPYIPCHRVIASNLFVGGFCGEWGPQSKSGTQYHRKLDILKEEGVKFDAKGKLLNTKYLWDRKSCS
ncbi:hypothetical protein FRC00_001021 [Tulasnella sp. 408]|nr:hypothetical protein FRC00_001021 [Tulasnella sp. 408]